MKTTMEELAPYMRGWRSYFGFCETPEVLIGLARWVRLRLPGGNVAAVENTAPSPGRVTGTGGARATGEQYGWQRSRPWHLAKAKALAVGLSNAYFKSLGLPSLFEDC
jgi:RNA-directed DNA polymerase